MNLYGFGDIHGPKPYEFIGFGDIDGPKLYEFIGFGDSCQCMQHGACKERRLLPKPYEFVGRR